MLITTVSCEVCFTPFEAARCTAKYCSPSCRKSARAAKQRDKYQTDLIHRETKLQKQADKYHTDDATFRRKAAERQLSRLNAWGDRHIPDFTGMGPQTASPTKWGTPGGRDPATLTDADMAEVLHFIRIDLFGYYALSQHITGPKRLNNPGDPEILRYKVEGGELLKSHPAILNGRVDTIMEQMRIRPDSEIPLSLGMLDRDPHNVWDWRKRIGYPEIHTRWFLADL